MKSRDSRPLSTEGLCQGNQEHTHTYTCHVHAYTSQDRGDRQSHSVRGKNTEIKHCVLVVFNLVC